MRCAGSFFLRFTILFFIFLREPLLLLACQKELAIIGRADAVHAAKNPTQRLALLVAAGLRDARD